MRIYAYVSSESCTVRRAVRPGEEFHDVPISKHGDFRPWPYGKRATKNLLKSTSAAASYTREMARKVINLLDWED